MPIAFLLATGCGFTVSGPGNYTPTLNQPPTCDRSAPGRKAADAAGMLGAGLFAAIFALTPINDDSLDDPSGDDSGPINGGSVTFGLISVGYAVGLMTAVLRTQDCDLAHDEFDRVRRRQRGY